MNKSRAKMTDSLFQICNTQQIKMFHDFLILTRFVQFEDIQYFVVDKSLLFSTEHSLASG